MDEWYFDTGYWHDGGIEALSYADDEMRLTLRVAAPNYLFAEDSADFEVTLSMTLLGYRVLEGAGDVKAVESALASGGSVEILNAEADFRSSRTVNFILNTYTLGTHESRYAEFEIGYEHLTLALLA